MVMTSFLDEAVRAHNQWLERLKNAATGGAIPNRESSAVDDQCDLGKWIHGKGTQYSKVPEFKRLREVHQNFHQAVGVTIDLLNEKRIPEARAMLSSGDVARLSLEVKSALTFLVLTGAVSSEHLS
jgi:methyl-accepting chemotaxis protein